MQIYRTPKITGFTANQLAQRLEEALINEKASQEVKEKYSPTYRPIEMPLKSEQEATERVMRAIDNNPMTRATTDGKWDLMKQEYNTQLKQDAKARANLTERIEQKTQNELRGIGIDPDSYIYSREYERIEE